METKRRLDGGTFSHFIEGPVVTVTTWAAIKKRRLTSVYLDAHGALAAILVRRALLLVARLLAVLFFHQVLQVVVGGVLEVLKKKEENRYDELLF
jgi:hypothetical protein